MHCPGGEPQVHWEKQLPYITRVRKSLKERRRQYKGTVKEYRSERVGLTRKQGGAKGPAAPLGKKMGAGSAAARPPATTQHVLPAAGLRPRFSTAAMHSAGFPAGGM